MAVTQMSGQSSLPPTADACLKSPASTILASPRPRSNGTAEQQQLHAAARLQLAAALIEYSFEEDGKVAEQSAIFAPYRQDNAFEPGERYHDSNAYDANQLYQDDDEGGGGGGVALDTDNNVDHPQSPVSQRHPYNGNAMPRASTSSSIYHANSYSSYAAATVQTSVAVSNVLSRRSEVATSPEPWGRNDTPFSTSSTPAPVGELLDVNEDELTSEWGLDNVVDKFNTLDSNAFRTEASKISAAKTATSNTKKPKGRKRSGTVGSDILTMSGFEAGSGESDASNLNNVLQSLEQVDTEDNQELLDTERIRDSQSAPSHLVDRRKLRHRSGSEIKAARKSFESELELAFSAADSDEAVTRKGNRSRSSSLGTINALGQGGASQLEDAAVASFEYAAEPVARPVSSMSGYVSRFDPKAVAAQREEELASRPRFPKALHPAILVMPAPLADLLAEEEAAADAAVEAEAQAQAESHETPRIEREPGKLYGKSLMDELQQRKDKQKSRNRAFRGDSRRAMMDMDKYKRAPSPLGGASEGGEGDDSDEDDDDKPLRPASTDALTNEPWLKYTSHRSLARLSKGKSLGNIAQLSSDGTAKSLASPASLTGLKESTSSRRDSNRHTLSTAELQDQYRKNRQSMLDLANGVADEVANLESSDNDEDDDVPLEMRKGQLFSKVSGQEAPVSSELDKKKAMKSQVKEKHSVFGVDLVMQRELAKLEQILEIEEAEKKIQAERERIKDAEREAKERKKQAKAAKKEKKRKQKESDKALATGKRTTIAPAAPQEQEDGMDMQWRTDNRASRLDASAGSVRQSAFFDSNSQNRDSRYTIGHGADQMNDTALANTAQRDSAYYPVDDDDNALTPRGRVRSSSLVPSLTLPFLAGDTDAGDHAGTADTLAWFGSDNRQQQMGSDDGNDSDREERVRSKSPFGIENFASDDEDRVNPTSIWKEDEIAAQPRLRQTYDSAKKPELQRMSMADSIAGVLDGFGFNERGGSDDEDGDDRRESRIRQPLVTYQAEQEDSEEEERRPLSSLVLNNRSSQPFSNIQGATSLGKITLDPPRLDLPRDFATADNEASDSEEEDETPLALKKLNISYAAGAAGRTFDAEDAIDNDDTSEDNVPLAAKQDDDKPLGQAHPAAALSQQFEMQQQQNMALMTHMQMQYQYALQMQVQQAMLHQADMQGYSASQLSYVAPAAALSGAASDIGADLGPDPKLVSSVDRWRQRVPG